MFETFLEYSGYWFRNNQAFLLNFEKDFRVFCFLLDVFRSRWARIGKEIDSHNRSLVGLLPFLQLFLRHSIFGFQHLGSFQGFLSWLNFRPGLESFLILGKFIDEPANAEIWKNREKDWRTYTSTFSGKPLISRSMPRSSDFQNVLSKINDGFMHPNPEFTFRDVTIYDQEHEVLLATEYFDLNPEVHEAHLLAYLNLTQNVILSSNQLLNTLFNEQLTYVSKPYSEINGSRAASLANKNPDAKKIMEELGLWRF